MTTKHISLLARLLLGAGLVAAGAAAHASYTVTQRQENLVMPGMSQSEVLAALGRPEHMVQYRSEAGPTLTYHVASPDGMLFDIQFGVDGKVTTAVEHVDDLHGGPSD